jgi:hypothetical protein
MITPAVRRQFASLDSPALAPGIFLSGLTNRNMAGFSYGS